MLIPYTKIVEGTVVPSGHNTVIPIKVRDQIGFVTKLIVKQQSGTLAGFTACLFSSRFGWHTIDQDEASSAAEVSDIDLYRIFPVQTAASLASTIALFEPKGYPYSNNDSGNISVPEKYVYLEIRPAGTGNKVFDFALGLLYPSTG